MQGVHPRRYHKDRCRIFLPSEGAQLLRQLGARRNEKCLGWGWGSGRRGGATALFRHCLLLLLLLGIVHSERPERRGCLGGLFFAALLGSAAGLWCLGNHRLLHDHREGLALHGHRRVARLQRIGQALAHLIQHPCDGIRRLVGLRRLLLRRLRLLGLRSISSIWRSRRRPSYGDGGGGGGGRRKREVDEGHDWAHVFRLQGDTTLG